MMMLDLKQLIGMDVTQLIGDLQAINAKAAEHAKLPAKLERMKKSLASTEKELDRATAELEAAEAKLEKLQVQNQRDYAIEIEATQARLHEAWIAEEKANRELGAINTQIRDHRVVLDGLVHAIATLQARLQGKDEPPATLIARLAGGG